jgi:hypothetical protein
MSNEIASPPKYHLEITSASFIKKPGSGQQLGQINNGDVHITVSELLPTRSLCPFR